MMELVSIITPAFRAETMICHAAQSVLAQDHEDWEMLIIADDDCDYRHILWEKGLKDSRFRFYRSPALQSGPNIARNVGLAFAEGEWIAPLDADDIYYPQRLTYLLKAAHDTGLALDNVKIVGEQLEDSIVIESPFPRKFGFSDFRKSLVPLLFLFHRRHIHRGWDEDIARGADTLFNLRALESAGVAGFVAEPLHEYRVHGQSMCHASGAEEVFIDAYRRTLSRLKSDGLGFRKDSFRHQVVAMIEEKQAINHAFDSAVKKGFQGNYQSFVKAQSLC